jgi:hypothetical protein
MKKRWLLSFVALGFAAGCGAETPTDDELEREVATATSELNKGRGGTSKAAAAGFDRKRVLDGFSQSGIKGQVIGGSTSTTYGFGGKTTWKLCVWSAVKSGLDFSGIRNQCDSLFGN